MFDKIKTKITSTIRLKTNNLAMPNLAQQHDGFNESLESVEELVEYAKRPPGVLRLHLGCGQCYFPGYANIDYPPSHHTVQVKSPADLYADIRTLRFIPGTIGEVRLHHVFEHFDRPTALRLLADWHEWLIKGGILLIETPDFDACARIILSRWKSLSSKAVAMRHIFGSHEAHWAYHLDGWNKQRLKHTLMNLGFVHLKFQHTRWKGTRNIVVRACKDASKSKEDLDKVVKQLLSESLVDHSEKGLYEVWTQRAGVGNDDTCFS